MLRSFKSRAAAVSASALALASSVLAQDTPATMTDIVLPIDPASIASKVFAVGGTVLIAVFGIWIGFKLVRKAAGRMARGV